MEPPLIAEGEGMDDPEFALPFTPNLPEGIGQAEDKARPPRVVGCDLGIGKWNL